MRRPVYLASLMALSLAAGYGGGVGMPAPSAPDGCYPAESAARRGKGRGDGSNRISQKKRRQRARRSN